MKINLFCFSKNEKLKKKNDFKIVFKNGVEKYLKNYKIIFCENNLSVSRIGIITTKKIGNSIKRNYEKRVIRESFRLYKNSFKKSYDVIVIPFKCNNVKFRKTEINNFFIKVMCNNE